MICRRLMVVLERSIQAEGAAKAKSLTTALVVPEGSEEEGRE